MSEVTVPVERGGSGNTWSDVRGALYTMRGGGYITRLIPMLADFIGLGNWINARADAAEASAVAAAASAATAVNAPGTSATSTTSHNVSVGAKTFTIQTGKSIAAGARVVGARTSSPGNAVYAYVADYNSGTGQFDIVVDKVAGSGTAVTDWTFSIGGAPGADGSNANSAMELVSTATASNSAAIDFTSLDAAYDYIVVGEGTRPETSGRSIGLRMSTNNGSSYGAGASDYSRADVGSLINTNGDGTFMPITGSISTGTASDSVGFEVRIQNIGSTSIRKTVFSHCIGEAGSGAVRRHGGGYYKGSLSAVNAIRFFVPEGGNISAGTFRLYKVKRT